MNRLVQTVFIIIDMFGKVSEGQAMT